jgi:inner membrane protein
MADLVWILLAFGAGVIATRYIERMSSDLLGYLAFGALIAVLSIVRALLFARAQEERATVGTGHSSHRGLRALNYALLAAVAYLALSLLIEGRANPFLFIPAIIGALLPDLDSPDSLPGHALPFLSRRLRAIAGHQEIWHSLGASLMVAVLTAPLIPLIGWQAWLMLPLGFVTHLAVDLFSPEGVMLLWPFRRTRYVVSQSFVRSRGGGAERRLAAALTLVLAVLLGVADFGPSPPTSSTAIESLEGTLARCRSLWGRYLMSAHVDGVWQATGRRISARFEVIRPTEDSLILLDRYSGKVFTGGHSSADHLYLDRIKLETGSPIQVKPVELKLGDQQLIDALPVVYAMQLEPGLQHIFVSGEIIVREGHLPIDRSPTDLQRIQQTGERRYALQYLSGADLTSLANTEVDHGVLVVVATYLRPSTGPTATPLPSPPPVPEERQ